MNKRISKKEKHEGPEISNMLKMKPIKTGRKVKWSEEIDEVLYRKNPQ